VPSYPTPHHTHAHELPHRTYNLGLGPTPRDLGAGMAQCAMVAHNQMDKSRVTDSHSTLVQHDARPMPRPKGCCSMRGDTICDAFSAPK